MVLYTPIPLEFVLEGLEPVRRYQEAVVCGVPVLVEETVPGRGRVVRLLSTDPFDYLMPWLAPGTEVNLNFS